MNRGGPIARHVRVRAKNPQRLARLRDRQFSEQADLCRELPCCVCGAPPPSDPEHVRARGMGGCNGDDSDTVPMCRACHGKRHAQGHGGPFAMYDERLAAYQRPGRGVTEHGALARFFLEHVAAGLRAVLRVARGL